MHPPFKIAVFGLGGVGGFCGGKLASHYQSSRDVEIIFIARGENARAIESHGLTIVSPDSETISRPALVTNNPQRVGPVDLLLCTVKSYDLDAIDRLAPCIGANTAILPLLNGVDARDRVTAIFPSADVWDGCIYILARLLEPGVITITRNLHQMYFGSDRAPREKLVRVEAIFQAAGINAELADDMARRLWEKFIFISSWATATSYFDTSVAGVVHDEARVRALRALLAEIQAVAQSRDVGLPDDIVESTLRRIEGLPPEATSSMHADFQRGGKTELESLTGIVVRLGKEHGLPTPQHEAMLPALRARTGAAGRNTT